MKYKGTSLQAVALISFVLEKQGYFLWMEFFYKQQYAIHFLKKTTTPLNSIQQKKKKQNV